jgi:iron complex transport system ATP-binding protein
MTKEGFGIFMILHDLNLASSFADKVTILHNGNISASGKPKDVLQRLIIEESFGIKTNIIEHQNTNFIIPVFN